jgi:excinuclease UvrABC nuclease subunit
MSSAVDIFECSIDFNPAEPMEGFLRSVPAKWVVYLMADAEGRPIQLLCVKNLRASLSRRLGGEEVVGPSKKVNYREIVRRIYWRRVDSRFEADVIYLEAARAVFPKTYQGMVGFRPAWFVHVNPDAPFPRYVKTTDLATAGGELYGPVEDKHAAGRLIQLVEDAFDLCRYYNVLVEAPRGKACAYKEMGKCPAPCDGTISMDHYRRLVELSTQALSDPKDLVRQHQARMTQAATELRFESAAKIKAYVEQLSHFGKGAYRHVRRLKDFRFVVLQHGPKPGKVKLFLVTPGRVDEVLGVIADDAKPADLLGPILQSEASIAPEAMSTPAIERVGVVSHHLFVAKDRHGVFLPLSELDEKTLATGLRELRKQKLADDAEAADEGVIKELQAL